MTCILMEGRHKTTRIPQATISEIRKRFFDGTLNVPVAATELGIARLTVRRYEAEFKRIRDCYPELVDNIDFYAPEAIVENRQRMKRIPYAKITVLRKRYFEGSLDVKLAAQELGVEVNTVKRYANEFRKIKDSFPDRISDNHFFAPKEIAEHRQTELYVEFINVLPVIIGKVQGVKTNAATLYPLYKEHYPNGYVYSAFAHCFAEWCDKNKISRQLVYAIKDEDVPILEQWRKGSDHRLWQIAVALLDRSRNITMQAVSNKTEVCKKTIQDWHNTYKARGCEAFKKRTRTTNLTKATQMREREDNIIHLLHQSPKTFGYNRTSWKQADLADTYSREYGVNITRTDVSRDLRRRGYRTVKAREVLTSPDPQFREKYEAIQHILQNLGPKDKFFSIDEYGPFSLKIKGGRTFVKKGEFKTYPQRQKSKGWLICTAALELSTNQVSHFYSPKKNTAEMIKLVDILIKEYHDQDKIWLSWDKAAWHISKVLTDYVTFLNSEQYHKAHKIPNIGIAPLPACAQFLNVIESVFSGLARAVIHHSDYQSVDECQQAINRHFKDRNEHFKLNPHRAGNKIWGKELVPPHFDKAHRCKTSTSLSMNHYFNK